MENKNTTKILILFVVIVIFFIVVLVSRASFKRYTKSVFSEFNNGIERRITLYDYNGNIIKEYKGKFDVTESETGIMFDDSKTGKRVILSGGIVVNEEVLEEDR